MRRLQAQRILQRDYLEKNMKNLKLFFFVIFLAILVLSVSPFIGKIINNSNQYIFSIFDFSEQQKEIIYNIRLPQTLMAFFTGFALAVCGLMYQTIFQNDLASPYTLGVSSGAAVAAVISIKFNIIFNFAFFSNIGIFAFLGGILTLTLLFFFSSFSKAFNNFSLLLTGIALNLFFSALILLFFYMSNFNETFRIQRWLIGTIEEVRLNDALIFGTVVFCAFLVIYYFREDLNLISITNDEVSRSRGLNVVKFKILMLIINTLLVSLVVAFCGPIGFIGLICPHIAKLLFGYNHKISLIASGIVGAITLTLCFTIARLIVFPSIIPVGVITSLIGAPFLIVLIYINNKIKN